MYLKNKNDGKVYVVSTEDESTQNGGCASFAVFAVPVGAGEQFVMRYSSLAEFTDEWEDAD